MLKEALFSDILHKHVIDEKSLQSLFAQSLLKLLGMMPL